MFRTPGVQSAAHIFRFLSPTRCLCASFVGGEGVPPLLRGIRGWRLWRQSAGIERRRHLDLNYERHTWLFNSIQPSFFYFAIWLQRLRQSGASEGPWLRRPLSCIYMCLEAEINTRSKTQVGSIKERYLSLAEQCRPSECAEAIAHANKWWETSRQDSVDL